jgi:hypothetical protein
MDSVPPDVVVPAPCGPLNLSISGRCLGLNQQREDHAKTPVSAITVLKGQDVMQRCGIDNVQVKTHGHYLCLHLAYPGKDVWVERVGDEEF